MIPKFKQFRFYGDSSNLNNISKSQLISGDIFTEEIKIITQLGIRALPGTKFYINNNPNPVIIGYLGVLELDFKNGNNNGAITGLKFDATSISAINENLQGGYIIVDIIGMGGD